MATSKLYFDTRNKRASEFPVCVSISANNKTILIPTGIHLQADQWKNGQVVNRTDKSRLNNLLLSVLSNVTECLTRLQVEKGIRNLSQKEIKAEILQRLHPTEEVQKVTFSSIAERFIQLRNARTREMYQNTMRKVSIFCQHDSIAFDEISVPWLEDFRSFYERRGQSINTIAIDLRNIRAIFNYGRKLGVTKDYPFLNYRIEREKTRHRANPPEMICILRNWDVEPHQAKYRDIYLLIFYLLGINIGDLCNAKPSDVIDGRLEYRRQKTRKLYSVFIHPKAKEIVERYKGKSHLLNVMDGRANYKSFAKAMNTNIKQIGNFKRVGRGGRKVRTPILPDNTTYWMRHSWATIAHKAGISKDVISMALGHSFGVDTTDTYIDYDIEKVDDANKKVIEYLDDIENSEGYKSLWNELHGYKKEEKE